ncbi:UBE2J2 family protein [Megaselia abdita]
MSTVKKLSASSRLKQDYVRLKKDPVPYITAEPVPENILEWYFVINGPENSPYEGGYYFGSLCFAKEFPFKPPAIFMVTPNGRFKTNTRLCLSISDFHPDSWNPTWSVSSILTGLLSFMLESTPTMGSTETTYYEKKALAKSSLQFNTKNVIFCEMFPEICEEIKNKLTEGKKEEPALQETPQTNQTTVKEKEKESSSNNSFIFVLFLIFALIVNYVIKTI